MDQGSMLQLVARARALGAGQVPVLSAAEQSLLDQAESIRVPRSQVGALRTAIRSGADPLGEELIMLRSAAERRPMGQTFTPAAIILAMIAWVADATDQAPRRIVDPGAGSGRFGLAAARRFPKAEVTAVETDPVAALACRANMAAAGFHRRAGVHLSDYHTFCADPVDGPTVYIGNPPYVRHHQIDPRWKRWLTDTARERGLSASQLAGLHVHFFLATAQRAVPGDLGAFVTSAEWLDVNYGAVVRELLVDGLCGEAIHLLDPTVLAFDGAATTAAITCFTVGAGAKSIRLKRHQAVSELGRLQGGRRVSKDRLAGARTWTPLLRATPKLPEDYIELGELCRVHRGAVTGANRIWITDAHDGSVPPAALLPSVTKARELFQAGCELDSGEHLRRVIDLPSDLDAFEGDERQQVDAFLRQAKAAGAADTYVAQHRRAWWAIGLREPAPILTTYMARQPPAFVINTAGARHINIAHGLYPRLEMGTEMLTRLAGALRASVERARGRTYAGGLTKFEPGEVERLPVPSPEILASQ